MTQHNMIISFVSANSKFQEVQYNICVYIITNTHAHVHGLRINLLLFSNRLIY